MEGNQTEQQEQPAQIYDADNDKMIDNPALKVSKKEEESEEEESEEETSEAEKPKAKSEENSEEEEFEEEESEEESEESENEEESSEEEEEEEESEESEKTKSSKKDEGLTADQYVESTFGKDFGIKTEADLKKIIENGVDAQEELKTLKSEIETLKQAKPKFKNAIQESAYNFVSQFDTKMQGEALQTFAKLIGMDMDQADPNMLLEEKFIHENPQWTRSEAQRMFKKEYNRKYVLDRTKFEGNDEEFAEEQKDVDIMKKGDIAKAKTFLTELKAKHKPSEEEAPKVNEAVTKAVEKNAKEYTSAVEKITELSFKDGDDKYVFKLDADKKKQIQIGIDAWVKNPANYSEKGEFIGATSPEEAIKSIVGGMFTDDLAKALVSQIKNQTDIKRVEDIGRNKPKKNKSGGGDAKNIASDDLDQQAMRIIKKERNQKAA